MAMGPNLGMRKPPYFNLFWRFWDLHQGTGGFDLALSLASIKSLQPMISSTFFWPASENSRSGRWPGKTNRRRLYPSAPERPLRASLRRVRCLAAAGRKKSFSAAFPLINARQTKQIIHWIVVWKAHPGPTLAISFLLSICFLWRKLLKCGIYIYIYFLWTKPNYL